MQQATVRQPLANIDIDYPKPHTIVSTRTVMENLMKGEDTSGKPLDCIGIPIQAQVGKHDFIKLTPQEAKDKGLLLEDGSESKAHLGQKFVDPKDWTKTKVPICVPCYTELEAQLITSLRQIRSLLVNTTGINETDTVVENIQKAYDITHRILSEHEVPSAE